MNDLIRLDRLNVRRLAADYSAAIRSALTEIELANVRGRNEAEADPEIDHAMDYVDTGELMAGAILLQRPRVECFADLAAEMIEAGARAKASGFRLSRILVACEYSATVRDTFAARGHDVMSCDVLPSDNPHGQHYQGDVRDVLGDGWDMMVAHPPCTYLAACQLWRCQEKHDKQFPARQLKSDEALEFVRDLDSAPIAKRCIENPKGRLGTDLRPWSQSVQPYQFGHDHSKETGLWLTGLPLLVADPADYVEPRNALYKGKPVKRWGNQSPCGADRMGPSADRGHKRSRFFQGFADAMADQWGGIMQRISTAEVLPLGQLALF